MRLCIFLIVSTFSISSWANSNGLDLALTTDEINVETSALQENSKPNSLWFKSINLTQIEVDPGWPQLITFIYKLDDKCILAILTLLAYNDTRSIGNGDFSKMENLNISYLFGRADFYRLEEEENVVLKSDISPTDHINSNTGEKFLDVRSFLECEREKITKIKNSKATTNWSTGVEIIFSPPVKN